ncbi:MAG: hypothetical protein ACK5GN_03365 [Pseudomonadota bacterium]|jgi:hypothetical protein
MTKGSEYITSVLKQVMSDEATLHLNYQGAFLAAALSLVRDVESPLKERALVSLASVSSNVPKKSS